MDDYRSDLGEFSFNKPILNFSNFTSVFLQYFKNFIFKS